jgi:hypothetical protein
MNRFLGCWFGLFPFPLRDICGNLTPSNTVLAHLKYLASAGESVSLPPNSIKYADLAADPTELKAALESLEAQCEELSASRSLSGSSTSSTLLGSTCQSEVDFSSVLKRYYTETFAELIRRFERADETFLEAWCMQQLGLNSRHRQVMRVSRYQSSCEADVSQYHGSRHSEQVRTLWTILDPKDALLALSLCTSADTLYQQVTTLEGLMQHLENRGHPEVTAIDGLTVELLPFQKQSVQWAKERESVAGGIQRFLWTKVPLVDDELVGDLYYCPLLGKFSKVQPQVARGGIIGEMMGRKFLKRSCCAWLPSLRLIFFVFAVCDYSALCTIDILAFSRKDRYLSCHHLGKSSTAAPRAWKPIGLYSSFTGHVRSVSRPTAFRASLNYRP